MGFIALTRIWTKDLICCLYWNDNASFTNIFYNLLWINEDFSAEGLITNKVISGCLCLGIDVCIYMMESFFSEIFLRFAWCKIQHAPVPSLLRGILLVLQIWVRTRVVWETASLILDSFLFSTAHFDSIWISCLPCGWCIEVQCLIWVKFGSALLNWQETLLFFFFGGEGREEVQFSAGFVCWNGSAQAGARGSSERWGGKWICGTWQSDQLALLHCHSQNNLKISSNSLVKVHVLA